MTSRRTGAFLGCLALIAIPFVDRDDAHMTTLVNVAVYVLLALGLNIVVGFAGLLDLGYAAFFAIGSYTYAMLASTHFGLHLPFWPLLAVCAGVAAAFGVVLGAPTLRLRGDYLAIVTLGFGEIVPQVLLNLQDVTGGPNGIGSIDQPAIGSYAFGLDPRPYYFLLLGLVALGLLFSANLRDSRMGRAFGAIREDEVAAVHMGIDATRTKLLAFAIGASFAGVAGAVNAAQLGLVSPDQFKFNVSVTVLAMLVLGGMGSLTGVVVGSVVLSALNFWMLPQASNIAVLVGIHVDVTNYRFLIYGVILIAMMLLRPQGLVASRQRAAELTADDAEAA